MGQPFGRYVEDEQRDDFATTLMRRGYEVSTREHGGWGGGTEWIIRRWRTRYHILLGWILPVVALIFALASIKPAFTCFCLAIAAVSFILFAIPSFSAAFM